MKNINVEPICDKCKTYITGKVYAFKHKVKGGIEYYVLCKECIDKLGISV